MDIRLWDPERDEGPLLDLFNASFGQARDPAEWRWKLRDNPAGEAVVALAEEDGRPISMACALPVAMRVGGRAARGSASVDVATHPDHRGRGIYAQVARHLYAALAEGGFALTYGFTNAQSTRVTLATLGRREVRPHPLRVRPLRPLALLLSRLGLGSTGTDPGPGGDDELPAGVTRVTTIDERWDALWAAIEPATDIATVRGRAWTDWRLVRRPDAAYEVLAAWDGERLAAWTAWRPIDRFGTRIAFVADLCAPRGAGRRARALLQVVARRARRRGATLLCLLSAPGAPVHDVARRFTLRMPPALAQTNVFSVVAQAPGESTAALADAARWWIAWSDADVV